MSDLYANIGNVDSTVQSRLARVMEMRAADPRMREMLETYLGDMPFPAQAKVLEVGCGTGAICRVMAGRPDVGTVVGTDLSEIFLAQARDLAAGLSNLTFEMADGRSLPLEDESFDVAVFHTSLCHIPGPEQALAEARRVLRPGGWLAIFDGDYVTTTLATCETDPLQACADAAMKLLIHDRWLVRRLPALISQAGFRQTVTRSHGLLQTSEPGYLLTIAERGADALAAWGQISQEMADALKSEARRRVAESTFFGFIAYASITAEKEG